MKIHKTFFELRRVAVSLDMSELQEAVRAYVVSKDAKEVKLLQGVKFDEASSVELTIDKSFSETEWNNEKMDGATIMFAFSQAVKEEGDGTH